MDELQHSIYVDRFRLAFHTQRGTAFQDWFVRLAGYAFGADFEEVRPYGPYGDLKCDGRRVSTKSVFQCYAPDAMKEAELIAKVDEDFHGARGHWNADMAEWVFVHNDGRGLPPNAVQHIDSLRQAHAPLTIQTWSEPELLKLAMGLELAALQALFGPAASIAIVDRLVMADLVPIIEALQRQDPNAGDPPLTPPSLEKLEKNALSEESGLLLRIGRRKSSLVDTFFRKSPRPDLGERIAEVGERCTSAERAGARVIDGRGGTLMPGMVEAHAHLTFPSSIGRIVRERLPAPEKHQFIVAHNAKVLLEHGFTSAFSGGATRPNIEVTVRDEIAAGWLPGPRIKASSFERGASGVRDTWTPDVEQARRFAEEMIALGVDSMKLLVDGRDPVDPSQWHLINYGDSELSVITQLARAADVNVTGHVYMPESIKMGVRWGFHVLYHCNFADQEAIDMIVAKKDQIFVAPCVGILMADAYDRYPTRAQCEATGAFKALDGQRRVIPELHRRGVRVVPGGDYGFQHNPHGRDARDLELFVTEFGFTPLEALRAATKHGGELMRMGEELGQIKAGYLADLLVVDGNPVADIRIMQDAQRLRLIMKGGHAYKNTLGGAAADTARFAFPVATAA